MELDEIFTGVIGFAIAMAIVGAVLGGAVYGYYLYAQHQTLANYLWPVVDVVPAQGGGYYMAVINTGHEPLFVKYIIYSNGQSQSVEGPTLYQNQHWLVKLQSPPAAVMVCSAINPSVCTVAPAHGWYVSRSDLGLIEVIVYDPDNATWYAYWSMSFQFGMKSNNGIFGGPVYNATARGNTTYYWFINPPYMPVTIQYTISAFPPFNSPYFICQVSSGNQSEPMSLSVSETYYTSSVMVFNITCLTWQQYLQQFFNQFG